MNTDEAEAVKRKWLIQLRASVHTLKSLSDNSAHANNPRLLTSFAEQCAMFNTRIEFLESVNTGEFPEPEPTIAERLDELRSRLHAAECDVKQAAWSSQREYYIGESASLKARIQHLEALNTNEPR